MLSCRCGRHHDDDAFAALVLLIEWRGWVFRVCTCGRALRRAVTP